MASAFKAEEALLRSQERYAALLSVLSEHLSTIESVLPQFGELAEHVAALAAGAASLAEAYGNKGAAAYIKFSALLKSHMEYTASLTKYELLAAQLPQEVLDGVLNDPASAGLSLSQLLQLPSLRIFEEEVLFEVVSTDAQNTGAPPKVMKKLNSITGNGIAKVKSGVLSKRRKGTTNSLLILPGYPADSSHKPEGAVVRSGTMTVEGVPCLLLLLSKPPQAELVLLGSHGDKPLGSSYITSFMIGAGVTVASGSSPDGTTLTIRDDDVKLLCLLPESEEADVWRKDLLLAARGKLAPEVVYTRALMQSLETLGKSPVYASSVSDDLTESLKEFVQEATQGALAGADSAGLTGAAPPVPDSMLDVLPFASPSSLGATWERMHGAASSLDAAIKGNLEKKQAGLMGSSYKARFGELRFTENARGILQGDFVLWPSRERYDMYQAAIASGDMAAAGEVADDRTVLHLVGYEKAVWGGSKKSNCFELRHEGTKYTFRCSTTEIAQEWVASFVSFDELRQVMATRLQKAKQEEVRESGKASAADAFAGAKTRKDSMLGAKTALASYRSRSGLTTPPYVKAGSPGGRSKSPRSAKSPPPSPGPGSKSPPPVAKPSPKAPSPKAPSPAAAVVSPAAAPAAAAGAKQAEEAAAAAAAAAADEQKPKKEASAVPSDAPAAAASGAGKDATTAAAATAASTTKAAPARAATPPAEAAVTPKKESPPPAPVITGKPKPSAKRTKGAPPAAPPAAADGDAEEGGAKNTENADGTPKKPAARPTPPAPSASPPPASPEPPLPKKAPPSPKQPSPQQPSPKAASPAAGSVASKNAREDSIAEELAEPEQPETQPEQTSRSSGVSFRAPSPTGSARSASPVTAGASATGEPSAAASVASSIDRSEGVTPSALARRGVSFSSAPGVGAKAGPKKASPPAAHKSFVATLAAKSAADAKAEQAAPDASRLRAASLRKQKRNSTDPTAEIDADSVRFTSPRRKSVSQARARANSAAARAEEGVVSPSAATRRRSSAARRKSKGGRASQYDTEGAGETGPAVTGGGSAPVLARTGAAKRNPVAESVRRASVARQSIVAGTARPSQLSGASAASEASAASAASSASGGTAPAPTPPVSKAAGAVGSSRRASVAFRSAGRDAVGSASRVALMAMMDEEDEEEEQKTEQKQEQKAEQPSSGFGGTALGSAKPLPPSGPRPGAKPAAPQRISPEVAWLRSMQPRVIAERLAPGGLRSANEMLELYADRGQARSAMGFLHAMLKVGITPNATSYAHLLVAMAAAGQVQDAEEAFAALPASIRDSPQYEHCCNALFYAWERNGMLAKALAFVGTDGFGWQTADSGARSTSFDGPTGAPSPFPIGPRHAAYRLGARSLDEWKIHALLGAAGTARDEGSAQYILWHALCRGCRGGNNRDPVVPGSLTPSTAAYVLKALTACGALRTAERVFESLLHNQFEELSLVAASSQSMLTALSNLKSKGGQMSSRGAPKLPPSAKGKSDFGLQLGSVASGAPSAGAPLDFVSENQQQTQAAAAAARSAPGMTAATLATAEKDFMAAMFGEKSSEILRVKRERLHDFVSHQVSVEVAGDTARLHELSAQTVNDIARSYGLAAAAVGVAGVTANEACFAAMVEGYGRAGNVAAAQRVFDLFCTVHCTCVGLSDNAREAHPLARVLRAASRASDSGDVRVSAPVDLPHPAPVMWGALLKGLSSEAAIAEQDPEALLDIAASAVARMADIGIPLSAEHLASLIALHAEADQPREAEQLAEMAAQNPETAHHVSVQNALIRAAVTGGDEVFEYLKVLESMRAGDSGEQPLQGNCGTLAATIAAHAANGRLHQLQALVDTMLAARVTPSNAVYSELLHAMHSAGEAQLGVGMLDQITASDPGLVHRWGTHIGVSIVQLFAAGGSSDVTQVKAEDVVCMWQALQAPPRQRVVGESSPPVRRPLMPPRNWQVDGVSEFVVHLSCALHSVVQRLAGAGQLRAAVETVRMWTLAPAMPFGRIAAWLWSEEDSEEHVPRIEWSPMNAVAWAHHSAWLRDSVGVVFEWLERSLGVLTVACGAARQLHNAVYLFEGMLRLRTRAETAVLWRTGAGSSGRPGMEGLNRAPGRLCDSFARRRTLSGFDQMEALWAPERFPAVPEFAFSRAPPRVPTVGVLMSAMGLDAWGEEGEGWCVEVDALPWHALMQAYLLAGETEAALGVLPVMQDAGVMPTPSVLVTAVHAAVGGGLPHKAEQLVADCVASAERGHNSRVSAGHGVPPLPDFRLMLEWSEPVVTVRLRAAAAARRSDLVVGLWQQYNDGVLPHLGEQAGEVPSDAYLFALADVAPRVSPFPVLLSDVLKVLSSRAGAHPAPGTHAAQVLSDAGWSNQTSLSAPGVAAETLLQFTRRALLSHLLQSHVARVSSLTALALALHRNGCSTDARVLLRTIMRHTTGEEYSPQDALDDVHVSHRKEDENSSMRSGLRLPPAQTAPALDGMGCLQLKDADAASDGDFVTAGMFDTAFARGLLKEALEGSAPLQLSDTVGMCDLLLALGETGCVPEVAGLVEFALSQDATVSVVNGIALAALAALAAAGDSAQAEALWRDHRVDFSLMAERSHSMLQGLQGGLLQFVWQLAAGEVSPEAFSGDNDVTLHGLPAVDAAAVTAVASCRLMSLAARGQVHSAVMGLEACALALQLPLWPEAVTAVLHAVASLPAPQLLAGVRHERGVGVSCVKRIEEIEDAEASDRDASPSSPGSGRVRPPADGRWVSDTQVQAALPAPGAAGLLCRLEHAAQSMVGAGTWRPRAADVNLLVLLYGMVGETGTALTMAWALLDATAASRSGAAAGALGGSARTKACQQAAAVALATSWSAEVHTSAAGQDTSKLNTEHSGMASSGQCDTAEPWRVLRCWGATTPASRAAARSEVLPSGHRLLTGTVQGDPAAKVAFGFAGEASIETVRAAMFAAAAAPSGMYTRGVASRHATRGLEAATAALGMSVGDSSVQALHEIVEQRQGGTRNTASMAALQSAGGSSSAARRLPLASPEEVMIAAVSALVCPSAAQAVGAALAQQELGPGAALASWSGSMAACLTSVPAWRVWRHTAGKAVAGGASTQVALSALGAAVTVAGGFTARADMSHATVSHHLPRSCSPLDALRTAALRFSRGTPVLNDMARPAKLTLEFIERLHSEAGTSASAAAHTADFSVQSIVSQPMEDVSRHLRVTSAAGRGAASRSDASGALQRAVELYEAERSDVPGGERAASPSSSVGGGAGGTYSDRFEVFERSSGGASSPAKLSGDGTSELLVRHVSASDVHDVEAAVMSTQLELDTLAARLTAAEQEALRLQAAEEEAEEFARVAAEAQGMVYIPRQSGGEGMHSAEALALNKLRLGILKRASGELRTAEGNMATQLGGAEAYESRDMYLSFADVRKRLQAEEEAVLDKLHTMESGIKQLEETFARTLSRFQLGQVERQGMSMEQLKAASRGDSGAVALAVPQDEYRRAAQIVLSPFAVAAVKAQNLRVVRQAQGGQEDERKRQENHTSATVYASALLHTTLEQEHSARLDAVQGWEAALANLGSELADAEAEEETLLGALEALQVHHATAQSESKGMLSVVEAHRQRLLQELDAVIADVDSRKSAQREGIKAAIRTEEWNRGQGAIDAAHTEVAAALDEIRSTAAEELGKVGKRLQDEITAELQPMVQAAEAEAAEAAATREALEGQLEHLQGELNSIVQSSADMEMRLQSEERRLSSTLDMVSRREGGALALQDDPQRWAEAGQEALMSASMLSAATNRDAARLDLRLHLWNLTHTLYTDAHSYVQMLDNVEDIAVEGCQPAPTSRSAADEAHEPGSAASIAMAAAEMGADTDVADMENALFELYVAEYEAMREHDGALPPLPSWGLLSEVAQEEEAAAAAREEEQRRETERREAAAAARAAALSKQRGGRRPVSSAPRAAPAGFGASWGKVVPGAASRAAGGSPSSASVASARSAARAAKAATTPVRRAAIASSRRRAAESKQVPTARSTSHADVIWRQMTGLQK